MDLRLGDAFGFMQVHEVLLKSLEWHEYTAQCEPEINGLLLLVTRVREVAESLQSLFQAIEGLPVGRLFPGMEACLPQVRQCLVPDCTVQGVIAHQVGCVCTISGNCSSNTCVMR